MNAATIREMMNAYNSKKAEWVARLGTTEGFDAWFARQVMGA